MNNTVKFRRNLLIAVIIVAFIAVIICVTCFSSKRVFDDSILDNAQEFRLILVETSPNSAFVSNNGEPQFATIKDALKSIKGKKIDLIKKVPRWTFNIKTSDGKEVVVKIYDSNFLMIDDICYQTTSIVTKDELLKLFPQKRT